MFHFEESLILKVIIWFCGSSCLFSFPIVPNLSVAPFALQVLVFSIRSNLKPYLSHQYGIRNSGTYLTVSDRLGKSNGSVELMCRATIVRSTGIYFLTDFNHLRKINDTAELSYRLRCKVINRRDASSVSTNFVRITASLVRELERVERIDDILDPFS